MIGAVIIAPALAALLAACGDRNRPTADPSTNPTNSTNSTDGSTDPTSSSTVALTPITHPTGANDVVLRITYTGGLVPSGVAFANQPALLVTGDGRVITPGATTMIYPGPLLPVLSERSISEAGIARLLQLAAGAHLLQTPPDYSAELTVADAPSTVVEITANGATFRHEASALGFDSPSPSSARAVLGAFVEHVLDVEKVAGAENLGHDALLVATAYRIQARPVSPDELASLTSTSSPELSPRMVAWPAASGVRLADAFQCAVVPAGAIGSLLADANQLTYFTDGGATYQIAAIAMLPGDTCIA